MQRSLLIDAGSTGSRLHFYQWSTNSLLNRGVSYPATSEEWTVGIQPGLSSFNSNQIESISTHLKYLIDHAKQRLVHEKRSWASYRIYLMATGGMRQLPLVEREGIMTTIRDVLSNKTLSPFLFERDFARIISGEEEAVFAWLTANYLRGNLKEKEGIMALESSIGTLDMGGASTQIAFYVPDEDILESLFPLNLGPSSTLKRIHLYAKSFLQFGHISARQRHFVDMASRADFNSISSAVMPSTLTFCLHAGYSEFIRYPENADLMVEVHGPAAPTYDQVRGITIYEYFMHYFFLFSTNLCMYSTYSTL